MTLLECNIVVLDKADEILNMGFTDDVERMKEDMNQDNNLQCLMFSATTLP